jgi:CBS-domain-containing membrane protein
VLISELMSRDVVSVRSDTPLKEVAALLIEHGIGGMPVIDGDGAVLGIVSESDFVFKELGRDYVRQSRLARLFGRPNPDSAKVEAMTAGEVMTTPAVTIDGHVSFVREAAILMSEHGVNRLPVTESGRLVGIITRSDIVRVFAQSDQVLEERVRDAMRDVDGRLLERLAGGVVTLAGTVATRELAETAVDVARAVDGVVAVNAERLVWTEAGAGAAPSVR